jgi:hypothetical protein
MGTTQLDWSVGIGKEGNYGEAVTPDRFFESDAKMKYDKQKTQSKTFRPTKRVQRLNRNVLAHIAVSGDQNIEPTSKGFGFLLAAALGVVTNTAIATTSPVVHQQVHTLRKVDPVDSYTIQEVLPTIGGGDGQPHTFSGCVADSIEFDAKEGGILAVKLAWLGRDMDTDTGATPASYPTDDELFTFVGGSIGYSGTLTPPTTTALASLDEDPSNNVSDFSVSVKNNLDTSGYNSGGSGLRSRPNLLGKADIAGKITAEYSDNTLRDAYVNQTPLPLVLNFVTETVLSETPVETVSVLQIVIPAVLLKGEIPTSNDGAPITQSIDWEAFDNGAASESIWIVYRTLDTAV